MGNQIDADLFLENGAGKWKCNISGLNNVNSNWQSIDVEDVTVDVAEVTGGSNWDYRVYKPGDAHYGRVTLRARVGATTGELRTWTDDASVGKNIRRDITVTLLNRDGSDARSWELKSSYPVRYDAGDYNTSSTVTCETIVCKIGYVELTAK